jgi:Tol biopolymer transport system component
MGTRYFTQLAVPAVITMLSGCGAESGPVASRLDAMSFANSEWSEPVNLGPVVNSNAGDNNPTLSSDGLSLYFASDRPGGLGNTDIWVARRASNDGPWETPIHLGAPVNTASIDGGPVLSPDGHLLFVHSSRPGSFGGNDIWVAHRTNTNDDTGWEAPVNLGPDVNTPDAEQGTAYVVSDRGGALYFTRGVLTSNAADLYRVEVARDGRTQGPATPVTELNDPATNDAAPTLRADGREIFFWSTRAGGMGWSDIWVSTRRSVNDPWYPPVSWGGPPFNTTDDELQPDLSHDGRTLLFTSSRPGGSGSNDIWMSTRTPSGQ